MNALMSIEGFRNLNQEIETIINKSEGGQKDAQGQERRRPDAAGKERTDGRGKGI